ncbi:hypothetical protein D6D17_06285 [Aureobasidium pullulans]|nr:hypothetical protein D6D17_06285 [Aureobasidium pullulans]
METGPAKLEKLMASCEHGIWGFVIYRSAYGPDSDTDFSAFIQHLKELVAEYDEIYGKHPILRETDSLREFSPQTVVPRIRCDEE